MSGKRPNVRGKSRRGKLYVLTVRSELSPVFSSVVIFAELMLTNNQSVNRCTMCVSRVQATACGWGQVSAPFSRRAESQ